MNNFEKHRDEIIKALITNGGCYYKRLVLLDGNSCEKFTCKECHRSMRLWLEAEYEEPNNNWNNIEVDTPILVTNAPSSGWNKRHFSRFVNGRVYAWDGGTTSFTADIDVPWAYAKLLDE